MELNNLSTFDIYNNKSRFKLIILIVAFFISGASIYYTNQLVKSLAEREQKLIDLYARGLIYAADPDISENLSFLFQEIIEANNSIPVILTDENENPISEKNIKISDNLSKEEKDAFLQTKVKQMKEVNTPIVVEFAPGQKNYIFYQNSYLLSQLQYYPYIQLSVIFIFSFIAYLAFSYSRNAEQNRVWVGLAKETAHQLGTPLSSLMAWIELFKANPKYKDDEAISELEKDVERLERITARFSNIGSAPALQDEPIYYTVEKSINYLSHRVSRSVEFKLSASLSKNTTAKLNKPLFEWVIENICKNAVDAIKGKGLITINLSRADNKIMIDISDTGKGIPKSSVGKVFMPGYTTKKRGWGLGLTLVKRIVENYHKGKIFVLNSEVDKGTTFRIILNN
ncbi:HAMP domain-containing sensor histidine kinase [Cytophagaceae bacterium ABcell3]|nr:HAMP domain-containing sensor histidine kinase [Cytophagaceae bacterium ABcell3]